MKERATIFGGSGKMGMLTNAWFQKCGYETEIVDPTNKESLSALEATRISDILFFSVDPSEVPKIIDAINSADEQLLNSKKVLDNAGFKAPFRQQYDNLAGRGTSICSTHTLFGPNIGDNTSGETVLIMPFGDNSEQAVSIAKNIYGSLGANLKEIDMEEHDEIMIVQQAIPHTVMRMVDSILSEMGYNFDTLFETGTANSKLFWISLARVSTQPPGTSARIIRDLGTQSSAILLDKIEEIVKTFRESDNLEDLFRGASEDLFRNDSSQNKAIELTNGVIRSLKKHEI